MMILLTYIWMFAMCIVVIHNDENKLCKLHCDLLNWQKENIAILIEFLFFIRIHIQLLPPSQIWKDRTQTCITIERTKWDNLCSYQLPLPKPYQISSSLLHPLISRFINKNGDY